MLLVHILRLDDDRCKRSISSGQLQKNPLENVAYPCNFTLYNVGMVMNFPYW